MEGYIQEFNYAYDFIDHQKLRFKGEYLNGKKMEKEEYIKRMVIQYLKENV